MSTDRDRAAAPAEAEITRLVQDHPLAWLVTLATEFRATPLPLRPITGDDGAVTGFQGHFARANDHVRLLRAQPRALILFMGVNGYVSPSYLHDRTQAPTWNYASAQYLVEVGFLDDPAGRDAVLEDQVNTLESGRDLAWSAAEMGARYTTLARGIVAFRTNIIERRVKFKLGQDERDDVYADICSALETDHAALHAWMQRANPRRTPR